MRVSSDVTRLGYIDATPLWYASSAENAAPPAPITLPAPGMNASVVVAVWMSVSTS